MRVNAQKSEGVKSKYIDFVNIFFVKIAKFTALKFTSEQIRDCWQAGQLLKRACASGALFSVETAITNASAAHAPENCTICSGTLATADISRRETS